MTSLRSTLITLAIACLASSLSAEKSPVMVPGSEGQWPMSGGPDGSWKVKTDKEVPIKWSVRNDENIKWKTALPEGGQSGIAVWGDKLFLTINPPLDTPPFLASQEKFQSLTEQYETGFAQKESELKESGDAEFAAISAESESTEQAWNDLLANSKKYQNANGRQQKKLRTQFLKEAVGLAYTAAQKAYLDFIYKKAPHLKKLAAEVRDAEKVMNTSGRSSDIILYCLNVENGEVLWTQPVKGVIEAGYGYGFSDSTTPCPITDGEHVWAINSSGGMACFTVDGEPVWERTWNPTSKGPFNKQFDSILYGDIILNMEPKVEGDETRKDNWNYLHAFDKKSGERLWVTEDAMTYYNAPVIGAMADGTPAVLIGRGGPHQVPERPVGLSLIRLEGENAGDDIWSWTPGDDNKLLGWGSLSTQHWDTEKAGWFDVGSNHYQIDTNTGETLMRQPLNIIDQYVFDEASGTYKLNKGVEVGKVEHQRHCNMSTDDHVYVVVRYEPFLARHNMRTGKNEHVQVPTEIGADGKFIWDNKETNDGLNSQGQRHGADSRTRGGGFQKCFLGSPTMVNNYIFFTNAIGLVYVVDANAEVFDDSAIVAVNDLGKSGETWTVNSLSFANGNIFHRTTKEIICIGK